MSTTNKERLLIVGSIAFDTVETPAGRADKALGGSACYASVAASFYCEPCVVGVVGEDFGREHFEVLEHCGVDTRGIERAQGKTFHWKGRYGENFKERDTLVTCLNVFEDFDPVLPDDYKSSEYVFLGNIDPGLQEKVLDQVSEARLIGMDTMNFWIQNSSEQLHAVLRRADILFINDEEALEISGKNTILEAAKEILARGTRYVVVKRGEYGALLFGDGLRLFVPAVLLPRVVDPTGAGDTFAGGFLGYLSGHGGTNRRTLAKSLVAGTVMASFAVEEFSLEGLKGLTEGRIGERFNQLEEMMRL